jgi:uncharacterized protein (DUF1015 family)
MATIRAFRGLRFSKDAGQLSQLVAPPYDVISPEGREVLAGQSPNNIVHATLPESREDDRSKFVKYARSSAQLAEWRRNGTLQLEDKPSLYRYTQTFHLPGNSAPITRTQLMVLLKVEPYENGVVLPHEQTFPKHKEDRLRILEATRSHLECIYGLFEDDGRSIHDLIANAPVSESNEIETEDGVVNRLEVIDDPEVLESIISALGDRKVWIADGHHRYETAVTFREQQGEKDGLIPEDFMMMALSSMSDPGLVILPTHRIVDKMPVSEGELDNVMQRMFNVRRVSNGVLRQQLEDANRPDTRAFGIALPSGMGLICNLDRPQAVLQWTEGPESERWKLLDVTILHKVIFERLLGLSGLEFFRYTRDADEAIESVRSGSDAAFLMNPPSVEDMRVIALGKEKMPQKSTYYYPKLLSGLVVWSLSDF